ncbi:PTS sugar transporter subunit IIA [Enterococcus durans]|uniref:PTS sugar transporter subunit IIA n=1 Tax=Enterococcus durans TaxID=53345 RepID=UPI00232F6813|nr:PTS sugar transporter subunit IIA [Enterococcus durans]MDB1652173.1 PTS sugar transporter subunit IIA [Enterococcus durans]MDB1655414.1 PTS sugar transporter subunit IIA [Enterococcus durans]MDB1663112.1 PTS sugar transporter subunit IIA [Enterococcus durans]MDB1668257.1 PTS sugar transporter subunit IIA [Enterococcus durans]MDB1670318.1 PTS sugar transporter subunit IIA [Enterococcus durans]
MKDNFIQLFSEVEVANRDEAYEFISNQLFPNENEKALLIRQALYKREDTGNIQIDEGVVLPHIEDEIVDQTFVAIIQPKKVIQRWSSEIANIDLIIAVLLSPNESNEEKKQIARFMRQLADEDFIKRLKTIKK